MGSELRCLRKLGIVSLEDIVRHVQELGRLTQLRELSVELQSSEHADPLRASIDNMKLLDTLPMQIPERESIDWVLDAHLILA